MDYSDLAETITLIAAVDQNLAIGKGGKLPWEKKLRADMKHFEDTTRFNIVVMGRKTHESIPEKYRPLRDRENWILTRDPNYSAPGCRVFHHAWRLLRAGLGKDLFIIGGAEIYGLFFPHATKLIITHVDTLVEGADAFFPELPKDWSQKTLMHHEVDERNHFPFSIVEYTKIDKLPVQEK